MNRLKFAARAVPLAAVLVFFACAKKEAAPIDTGVAMAPPAAMTNDTLRVDGVETGKGINADKTIMNDAHDFGVRDTIYASVRTKGAGTGKLSAKWTFQDGQTVNESSQDISPTAEANNEFHITKPTAWPKGNYKVDIMLNGVAAGTKDFTIK